MQPNKMTSTERRAVVSLSSIMALRMVGLFMVLPVFSLYARNLQGSTDALIGLAMGIYGLGQAIFQIPFGVLSDKVGRKPIIAFGLVIFILGSILSGFAHSINWMIAGRALQGMGAVGSTILALMADFTREDQRTKAMAISGMTIGFSFSVAMFLGPLLTRWMNINELFFLAALFGSFGIILLYTTVPHPSHLSWHRDTEPEFNSFLSLLTAPELAKLNVGIFILHAFFTASFIVIPIGLYHFSGLPANQQWFLYVPTLIVAFIISIVCIGIAEAKQLLYPFFGGGILALVIGEAILWAAPGSIKLSLLGLGFFFTGFSLLEAFLPSLISRTAPAARKGSALGIYSCSQFLGIFVGGLCGGWLYGKFGYPSVYLFCIILAIFWLLIALFMKPPRFLTTQLWPIKPNMQKEWEQIAVKLRQLPGMVEVTYIAEDNMAYIKMERATAKHPDFLQLKDQLQSKLI